MRATATLILGACSIIGCDSLLGIGDLPQAVLADGGLDGEATREASGDGGSSGGGADGSDGFGTADGDDGDHQLDGANVDASQTEAGGECMPRAARCSGSAVETCGQDGRWSAPVACATGKLCFAGACAIEPVAVSAGLLGACAMLSTGSVSCWGDNSAGEVGDDTKTGPDTCPDGVCSTTPVAVSGLAGAIAVVAGGDFACAVLNGGTAECWGSNASGRLGNGTETDTTTPGAVSGVSAAIALSAGLEFGCVLLSGGTVACWGDNTFGELGDGTSTGPDSCARGPCSTVPVPVSTLTGATALASGAYSTCALLSGGTVECWGDNAYGELGAGTSTGPQTCSSRPCSTTPVAVNLSGATAVAVGSTFACALLSGGTVDCWGQVGSSNSSAPVAVSGLSGVSAIAVGDESACALLSGGTVGCWGAIASGATTPTAVTGLSSAATAITVGGTSGGDFACALLVGGTMQCWGDDNYGELGDGMTVSTPTPSTVSATW